MKHLKTGALWISLLLCSLLASSQKPAPVNEPNYNMPKLFADLPQQIAVSIPALETLLGLSEGQAVSLPLVGNARLVGVVVSRSNPADSSVKSIVINATNRGGATFTFTRIRNTDGSFDYLGRILSYKNSDAYELVKEAGQYRLVKRHLYDIFSE
ncbi:MAG: hypothetical protein JWP27_2098 [Flaviaesturariibacter sp.]|nr:hypothetical protein [Flaviaesturariibacter sp.]